jgi:hypothetical protein
MIKIKSYRSFREDNFRKDHKLMLNEEFNILKTISNLFNSKSKKDWKIINQRLIDKFKDDEDFDLEYNLISNDNSKINDFIKKLIRGIKGGQLVDPFKKGGLFDPNLSDSELKSLKTKIENLILQKSGSDEAKKQFNQQFTKLEELSKYLQEYPKKLEEKYKNFNFLQFKLFIKAVSEYKCEHCKDLKLLFELEGNSFQKTVYFLKKFDNKTFSENLDKLIEELSKLKKYSEVILEVEGLIESCQKSISDVTAITKYKLNKKIQIIENDFMEIKENYIPSKKLKDAIDTIDNLRKIKLPVLDDFIDKITITTKEIINKHKTSDEDIFFTHSSCKDNLSRENLILDVESRDDIVDDSTPADRYGFYMCSLRKDHLHMDARDYLTRATRANKSIYLYQIKIDDSARFLKSNDALFGQTNASTAGFAEFCKELGISGYYDPEPYKHRGGGSADLEIVLIDLDKIKDIKKYKVNTKLRKYFDASISEIINF